MIETKNRRGRYLLYWVTGIVGSGLLICAGIAWSISTIGKEVRSCLEGCSSPATLDSTPFTFLTFNLYHGFPIFKNVKERIELTAQHLRDLDPDFALLQEVPWRSDVGWAADYLAHEVGLNFVYLRGNGNSRTLRFEEGLAILSRYPLRDPRFTELSPRNGIFEHRIALAVIAETPSGPIQLVTVHLPWDRTNRINAGQMVSLETFIAELEPHPTILAGDFNAQEETPQIKRLAKQWLDAFRHINQEKIIPTCCLRPENLHKANAGQHFSRVDYVFLRGNGKQQWVTLDAKTIFDRPFKTLKGYRWASNHVGVLVEADLDLKN